jgi:signal transduction histidine kinase/CHASE3 domain sensor protein
LTGLRDLAVGLVSRIPARVQTKLLVAFLGMVALIILLGAVGVQVLSGINARTEDLIELQRKIAAYRQVQHDTTRQLYGVATALLSEDERELDGILRQLSQFGYDLDRLEHVAQDEVDLLASVREDYDRFIAIVTGAVERARAGQVEAAREVQLREARPLADRLERLTNQLVNVAEADMLEHIEASQRAYDVSRIVVVAFALGSIVLALGLGYVFSWSIIEPLTRIAGQLRRIATGEFAGRVTVGNRDELGALAADVNRTSEELGSLYRQIEERAQELSEALERQTATSEVLNVISRSTSELQPVLDAIVATAARLCRAEWATLYKLEAGGVYHLAAAIGDDEEFLRYLSQKPIVPDRETMAGRTALEGRTVHVPDILQDPEYTWTEAQAKGGFRTILGVPLLRGGAVIGVIIVARNVVRPFTDKEIDLVTTFADQAVIAIENVRLFDEVQARTRELTEALRQQTATADVLKVVSRSAFDLEAVLQTLVESAARLCDADKATITRQIGGQFYRAEAYGFSPEFMEYASTVPVEPERGSVSGRALLEGKVVHIADVEADPEYTFADTGKLGGFRTALGVPMLREDVPIGVMSLTRSDVRPFTDRQIELVSTFADQAVIAIENVRLFDEVQARTRELTRSVAELRTLSEVSQAVNSTLELRTVLKSIAAHAVTLAEADAGAFCAWDEEVQAFHIAATHALDEAVVQTLTQRPVRLGEAAVGRAGLERRAVQIPDIDLEPDYTLYDVIRRPGYRALLAVPLLRDETLVGGLVLCRKTPGAFAPETVELVQTLANQSVLAIENAELFDQIEQKSRELEAASRHKSEFLANMSHELRTPLNAVLGYAELIQDGIYGEVPKKMQEVLERIQQNGRHLLGLINDVLDLSKIEAGQLTLAPSDYSIRELVLDVVSATEALAAEKKLALEVDVPPGLPNGRGDERRLTQVLMNLVSNAIKFTEAGSVSIRAKAEDGNFLVTVSDTGVGIAPEDQKRIFEEFQQVDSSSTRKKGGTGLGLAIAKRIVELHGGRIWVDSSPGAGSTFAFTLPLRVGEREKAA